MNFETGDFTIKDWGEVKDFLKIALSPEGKNVPEGTDPKKYTDFVYRLHKETLVHLDSAFAEDHDFAELTVEIGAYVSQRILETYAYARTLEPTMTDEIEQCSRDIMTTVGKHASILFTLGVLYERMGKEHISPFEDFLNGVDFKHE